MGAPAAEGANGVIDDLMPTDEDLLYEEELLRNPFSLKMWWRYLQARVDAPTKRRYLLYERAVKALPGSYKVGGRNAGGGRRARLAFHQQASSVTATGCVQRAGRWAAAAAPMLRALASGRGETALRARTPCAARAAAQHPF